MAPDSIPVGSSYAKEIPKAIQNCKVFILILSGIAQKSKWIPKELDHAIINSKLLIPVIIEDCQLDDQITNHHFKWWSDKPYKGDCVAALKGRSRKPVTWLPLERVNRSLS